MTRNAVSIACATGHHRVCRDHPTRLCGCRCHDPINQLNDAGPAATGPAESIALDTVILDRRALRPRVQRHRGEHMPHPRRRRPAAPSVLDILAEAQRTVAALNNVETPPSTSLEVELFTGRRFDALGRRLTAGCEG